MIEMVNAQQVFDILIRMCYEFHPQISELGL